MGHLVIEINFAAPVNTPDSEIADYPILIIVRAGRSCHEPEEEVSSRR
jgi:hypothetical protein